MTTRSRRDGLTLTEVLVVISIIGMLMALVLTAVQASRESARRMLCQDHLRQQGLALFNHESAMGRLPSDGWGYLWVGDPDRGAGPRQPGGWNYATLPYIERGDLRRLGAGQANADKKKSLAALSTYALALFNCPSRRGLGLLPQPWQPFNTSPTYSVAKTDYAINGGDVFLDVGEGPRTLAQGDDPNYQWPKPKSEFTGVCFLRSEITFAHIKDGKDHTYLAGEKNVVDYVSGRNIGDDQSLYSGDDFDIARWTPLGWTPLNDMRGDYGFGRFGSAHPAGCNFLFCDGSVRTIDAFSTEVLRSMALECERFEFCPEVTAKACCLGLRIVEVPVRYSPRDLTEGKIIRWRDGWEALWTLWRWRKWTANVDDIR